MSRGTWVMGLVLLSSVLAGCSPEAEPEREPSAEERAAWPTVAVIGDSYMAGYGVEDPAEGMAPLMAEDLEMNLANSAVGGTGYVDGGPSGVQTYAVQAEAALASEADLYVVEGALNDWGAIFTEGLATTDQLRQAARTLYARLVDVVGADKVVVVGPVWPAPDLIPSIVEVSDLLEEEATRAGLPYIDPVAEQWFDASNLEQYISLDNVHPDAEGHAYLAERIADAIRDVG